MNKIIAAFAAALFMTSVVTAYSDSVVGDLQSNMIRLHIIAQSDSEEDQAVKLKVRDALLDSIGEKLSNTDREQCARDIAENLGEIEKIADSVLFENGFSYKSKAEYGKFYFPQKNYQSVTLPAGDYYGIRITLGEGNGHNWWCVMYPPMCVKEDGSVTMSGESEKQLRETLDSETYEIITKKKEKQVKFKIVELIQQIKQKVK